MDKMKADSEDDEVVQDQTDHVGSEGHEAAVDGQPLCPHCLVPVSESDHFCPECCRPISSHASIDPVGQVQSAGWAYQRSVDSRPGSIVLLGVWLLFAPPIFGYVYAFISIMSNVLAKPPSYSTIGEDGRLYNIELPKETSGIEWLQLLVLVGFTVLHLVILFKATKNHITAQAAAA